MIEVNIPIFYWFEIAFRPNLFKSCSHLRFPMYFSSQGQPLFLFSFPFFHSMWCTTFFLKTIFILFLFHFIKLNLGNSWGSSFNKFNRISKFYRKLICKEHMEFLRLNEFPERFKNFQNFHCLINSYWGIVELNIRSKNRTRGKR